MFERRRRRRGHQPPAPEGQPFGHGPHHGPPPHETFHGHHHGPPPPGFPPHLHGGPPPGGPPPGFGFGFGPGGPPGPPPEAADDGASRLFGIRRPLRFLTHKLGLDDAQARTIAHILDDMRIERAQAEVDHQRVQKLYAEAMQAATFDADKAAEAARLRLASAERLEAARSEALQRIHALLDGEQRERLIWLMRSGPLEM